MSKYFGVLISCLLVFNFKIILKERQERMQQRLQENAMGLTVASDDAQDVESGDQAPKQGHSTGTSFCVRASEVILQVGATVSW